MAPGIFCDCFRVFKSSTRLNRSVRLCSLDRLELIAVSFIRYMLKYAASLDKSRTRIYGEHSGDKVHTKNEGFKNLKISGVQLAEKRKTNSGPADALELGYPEVISFVHGLKPVHCTAEVLFLSTEAPEYR